MLFLYKKGTFLPKCTENLFLNLIIINMEYTEPFSGNNTDKQITQYHR